MNRRTLSRITTTWLLLGLLLPALTMASAARRQPAQGGGQALNEEYTRKIREYTTEPFFLTELVDHLPASEQVPSPDRILGYPIGAPDKLTYTKDINRYFEALEKASPRVKVFRIGKSEEGRE